DVAGERAARDAFERLDVAAPGSLDDLRWQVRSGRPLVPARRLEPVADVLLVEARLRATGRVRRRVPEARGVGRQELVDEEQVVGTRPRAELELRVSEDDPGALGDLGADGVQAE